MAEPTISGKLSFHVIVDDFHRTFSIDGPSGPNGVRLHYEMLQAGRIEKKKLRDFDLRADSHEAVLTEMHNGFPDYQFVGTWASYSETEREPNLAAPQDQRKLARPADGGERRTLA